MISLFTNKILDFFAIIFLIILNSFIGFFHEIKAESSIKALKKLTEAKTKVIRSSIVQTIPSSELVPGDVVIVSEGSSICCDLRLVESMSLMADEASITGESLPSIKDHLTEIKEDALPYEFKNVLFEGTTIVRGFGKGIVTKTAEKTYFATIAKAAEAPTSKSPFLKAVDFFTGRYAALLICLFIVIGVLGYFQGRSWIDLLYILIAELVSAVPEGLPIVVTTVLVVGAIKLSRKKTLVRYLPSVQTLGCATVIASDKTGTNTKGILEVKDTFSLDDHLLKLTAVLCNDAYDSKGDPIDVSLLKWVDDAERIKEKSPRVYSFPFDVKTRMMATANEVDGKQKLFVKGAYESLRDIAENRGDFDVLEEHVINMSKNGLRTIALGVGEYDEKSFGKWTIKIVGVIRFLDPPKDHVKEAVMEAKRANIKVMMITGDHILTAKAVAKEVNIYDESDTILEGKDIEKFDDVQLYEALKKTTVLARILPEHKCRVVKVLQNHKEIVAVSGDGVNDVPAIRAADLSIAMGSGSEAAKSVSKMIITDSNLKVIVEAIRNARVIADNIRKVIYYLLSSGLQEISLITFAIFSDLPLPLAPIQILWINVVTDGVQDKTFPFAKEEGNVMTLTPKNPKSQFFDKTQIFRVLLFGLLAGFACFEVFKHLMRNYSYEISLSVTFTSVVVMQWFNGIQAQKENEPFFKNIKKSFTINPLIFLGVGVGLIFQLFAIYIVPRWFHAIPIDLKLWVYPIMLSIFAFFIVEIRKWIRLLINKLKN